MGPLVGIISGGARGKTGPTGIQGITGPRGLTGAIGARGYTGSQGAVGITGARGPTGIRGVTGLRGSTGSRGATGSRGPTGVRGTTGLRGPTGARGATGLAGATGSQGPTGPGGTTSDASWTGSNWTSITASPSQRAAQELAGNVGSATLASNLLAADNGKPVVAINTLDPEVRMLLHFENSLTDSSGYGLTLSSSNLTYSDSVYKFGSYSASFNGSSTVISIPQSGGIPELGTTDFTFRGWFYGTAFGSFNQLFEHSKSSFDSSYRYFCDVKDYSGTKKLRFQYIVDGSNYYGIDGSTTVTLDAWHNFELCRSSGVFYLFLDGNLEGTLSGHTGDSLTLTGPGDIHLGNQGNGANWWSGYMDDFEVILGTASHTSSFTAPTSAYSIDGISKYDISSDISLGSGILSYLNASNCITGSGSAALGSNCPATTATGPYKWLRAITDDGSIVFIPAWK